ncbi:MAG TPA: hypothetical protein VMB50_09155 [Myxococcales bacterium]|nr:hypothetical protein [Myxococcales bacterium]
MARLKLAELALALLACAACSSGHPCVVPLTCALDPGYCNAPTQDACGCPPAVPCPGWCPDGQGGIDVCPGFCGVPVANVQPPATPCPGFCANDAGTKAAPCDGGCPTFGRPCHGSGACCSSLECDATDAGSVCCSPRSGFCSTTIEGLGPGGGCCSGVCSAGLCE